MAVSDTANTNQRYSLEDIELAIESNMRSSLACKMSATKIDAMVADRKLWLNADYAARHQLKWKLSRDSSHKVSRGEINDLMAEHVARARTKQAGALPAHQAAQRYADELSKAKLDATNWGSPLTDLTPGLEPTAQSVTSVAPVKVPRPDNNTVPMKEVQLVPTKPKACNVHESAHEEAVASARALATARYGSSQIASTAQQKAHCNSTAITTPRPNNEAQRSSVEAAKAFGKSQKLGRYAAKPFSAKSTENSIPQTSSQKANNFNMNDPQADWGSRQREAVNAARLFRRQQSMPC